MNNTAKKILDISLKVATRLLLVFTVLMMIFTIFTVTTVGKNDRSIFGFKFYIVKTDSMSPSDKNADMDVHFSAGDIVIIKNVDDPAKMQAGDVISFISTNTDSYGETVTHMIREVKKDDGGNVVGYVTFGTNTGTDDEAIVEPPYILGKYSAKLPNIGTFFAFMKTTPGYIVCILVPFLLLILYNGMNVIRLFRKYKKEQTEIMKAEREEIEAEKKQNEEILRELQALKEQLARQSGGEEQTHPAAGDGEKANDDPD
ncbi:MAG: signal peptidase I [Clostridia bacterium]|nr:signal peptidase I [Clostridia bacterium]